MRLFFPAMQLIPPRFRRLWQNVTESLREKDIEKATEHKRLLEERQRTEERHRAETETTWRTRHFDKEVSLASLAVFFFQPSSSRGSLTGLSSPIPTVLFILFSHPY